MQLLRFFNFPGVQLVMGILLTFCGLPFAIADSEKHLIVTDIAPIHSLVSMVAGEQADVKLLVPPNQSPHSFSLKPTQIRIINQADLIVILSDDFTPTLSRHIKSIGKRAVVLPLSNSNEEHRNDKHGKFEQHLNDPHTWLNPENAIVWLDHIAGSLAQIDEKNRTIYENNATRAKTNLTQLHTEFSKQLTAVSSAHYIVYHDAYQHFARSYGLKDPIAIALSDARAPGAKKLRAIRAAAKQSKCVFSELQHDDMIVNTVTSGLPVKRAILDPMGSTVPIGPNQYPQMMQALVNNFVTCLT